MTSSRTRMFERTYVNQSVKVSESLSEVNLHSQKLSQKEKKSQKRKCKSKSEFRSPKNTTLTEKSETMPSILNIRDSKQ